MGSSSDDFAALRALLKLKRHEQPPPRYFNDLSSGIIHRLRGPDGLRHKSLLSLLDFDFGLKPALFYGLGVSCCAVALYAVVYLLVQDPAAAAKDAQIATMPTPAMQTPAMPEATPSGSVAHIFSAGVAPAPDSASTNPVLSTEGVTFPMNGFKLRPTPVKYEAPR